VTAQCFSRLLCYQKTYTRHFVVEAFFFCFDRLLFRYCLFGRLLGRDCWILLCGKTREGFLYMFQFHYRAGVSIFVEITWVIWTRNWDGGTWTSWSYIVYPSVLSESRRIFKSWLPSIHPSLLDSNNNITKGKWVEVTRPPAPTSSNSRWETKGERRVPWLNCYLEERTTRVVSFNFLFYLYQMFLSIEHD
jgi:hypothetical protein